MASAIASGGVEVRMQKFFSFVVFIQFNKIMNPLNEDSTSWDSDSYLERLLAQTLHNP